MHPPFPQCLRRSVQLPAEEAAGLLLGGHTVYAPSPSQLFFPNLEMANLEMANLEMASLEMQVRGQVYNFK